MMCKVALFNKSLGYLEAAERCNLFHFESKKLRQPLRAENAPGPFDFFSFLPCWNKKCKSPFSEKAECSKLSADAQKTEMSVCWGRPRHQPQEQPWPAGTMNNYFLPGSFIFWSCSIGELGSTVKTPARRKQSWKDHRDPPANSWLRQLKAQLILVRELSQMGLTRHKCDEKPKLCRLLQRLVKPGSEVGENC